MILGFKRKINGVPTFFVQKILACVLPSYKKIVIPKLHTIRNGNRWRKGMSIQMATGVRTKEYFQFNGLGIGLDICKNVQKIAITRISYLVMSPFSDRCYVFTITSPDQTIAEQFLFVVQVDGRMLTGGEVDMLAKNDGFDNAIDFFKWFGLKNFSGQLIHWTDLIY